MVFSNAGPGFQQLSEHPAIEDLADLMAEIAGSAAHDGPAERCRVRSGSGGPDDYRRGGGAKTKAPS
jgi:hypothetical protein